MFSTRYVPFGIKGLCICVCLQKSYLCHCFVVWPGVDRYHTLGGSEILALLLRVGVLVFTSVGLGLHPVSHILKLCNEDMDITSPCLLHRSIGS